MPTYSTHYWSHIYDLGYGITAWGCTSVRKLSGSSRRSRFGELGSFWRLAEVCATGEPNNFSVANYLENGLKLPKMQKIYIKMFDIFL